MCSHCKVITMSAFPETLNRNTLIETLARDICESGKPKVVIQAGHFPLSYSQNADALVADLRRWGAFSASTFDIGCSVAAYAAQEGVDAQLILLADAHKHETEYSERRGAYKQLGLQAPTTQVKAAFRWRRVHEAPATWTEDAACTPNL